MRLAQPGCYDRKLAISAGTNAVSMTLPVKPNLELPPRPQTQAKQGLYFFGPTIDMLLLGGGSIVLFFLLASLNVSEPISWTFQFALVLSYLVNYPHYSASYARLYSSWSEARKYPWVAFVWPAVLGVLAIVAIALPQSVAPWYCKGLMVMNGYHYSGQTYGVSLIFARKSGLVFNNVHKLALALPIYLSWLYPTYEANLITAPRSFFYGVEIPVLEVPAQCLSWFSGAFWLSAIMYVGLTAWCSFYKRKTLPLIFHMVVATQLVWFVIGGSNVCFNEFVPFFHCLQYLLITTYFYFRGANKDLSPRPEQAQNFFASAEFGHYYSRLVLVGVVMFALVPNTLAHLHICDILLAQAVVITFINLHHFLIDGSVWKLKRPDVGQPLVT